MTGTGMQAGIEQVTPDMARAMLEESEGARQRGVRKNRVAKLVHAIQSGQWRVTHQGIAVDTNGVVIDGQHRLHAIAQAGETVEVLIWRDVDPETFEVIDTGASRTPSDSLKIAGYTDTNVLAAVVRTMLVYEKVVGTTGIEWATLDKQVTTADILEYLDDEDRKEAAYASIKAGRMLAGAVSRHGATTPLAAANMIARSVPTDIGPDALAEFNARLADGVMLPSRSPILALRRWLVADTGYVHLPHSSRRQVTVSVTLKAMNDYALGIERALSIFRFGSEIIPAPIPIGARDKYLKQQEAELEANERAG